jgi:hypothetical protein
MRSDERTRERAVLLRPQREKIIGFLIVLYLLGFQFGPVYFLQCPAFAAPERTIDDSRLIEPAADIDRDIFVAE